MKPRKPIARRTPIKRSTKPIPRSRVRIRRVRKVKEHEIGQAIRYPNGIGGREICLPTKAGKEEYLRRTIQMWVRQDHRCALCGEVIYYPTFDHENGRGGGKRDDRIEIDGKRHNAAVCLMCNGKKGSRRVPYLLQ